MENKQTETWEKVLCISNRIAVFHDSIKGVYVG
jgi:hypothetical protein